MKVLYKRKGGISAPVLAILTFAVLLVVGVAILMYFYVIAPQATKQSQLSILGEPVLRPGDSGVICTVTIKNIGSDDVTLTDAILVGNSNSYSGASFNDDTIPAGESLSITITWSSANTSDFTPNQLYTVILQTTYGNFEFSAVYRA